ncbi:reverse transcriptase family protein [Chryseobacterium sp. WG14]|uniref:reverse transcriptase family protein n=1 Tax=Chryseobacterium sp. WG14 TaxID=2926909 RepID=UPI00211EA585|nr:reverse transcriptase family protein [Chryseobacterium sp. WG14]MCQ9638209.1 reverse transcriptase family protein [Chryseobacterium sp. WG14]
MSFPLEQFISAAKKEGKSQEYIDNCIKYIHHLESKGFPVIFSLYHLAQEAGVEYSYLKFLIGENDSGYQYKYKRYRYFKLQKKRGGYREIMVPSKDLKYIQKWILINILYSYQLSDSCKGFVPKQSTFNNALVHENSKKILKVDLLKFYDSITFDRVVRVFESFGYIRNLSVSLAKLVTAKNRKTYWEEFDNESKLKLSTIRNSDTAVLPQGAPTSPMLANIIAAGLDRKLEQLSSKLYFRYSRYADDLTFSITQNDGVLPYEYIITNIVESEGFFVNSDKVKIRIKGQRQCVTGLTVTNDVNLSKKYRKEIFRHLYFCRTRGVDDHLRWAKKSEQYNKIQFHDWLYGHICYINSINKEVAGKMLDIFKKIDWSID